MQIVLLDWLHGAIAKKAQISPLAALGFWLTGAAPLQCECIAAGIMPAFASSGALVLSLASKVKLRAPSK